MRYQKYTFEVPEEKIVRVLIDSDAKNEADDQFAIVQALLSPKFENVGLIAAHFGKENSVKRSREEIEKIFSIMGFNNEGMIFDGADHALDDEKTPVISDGAKKIIGEAMKDDKTPLYALFMGPLTDLASAYLMEPAIANKLKAIWLGGGAYPGGGQEFNLGNDINAANVVFASGIEVWQVPKNVYEMMPVSLAELEYRVAPCGEIGKYLFDQLNEHTKESIPRNSAFRSGESWVLGDSPAVGLLIYEHRFEYDWIRAPRVTNDMQYIDAPFNKPIRVYRSIDSRLILEDMYAKLSLYAKRCSVD